MKHIVLSGILLMSSCCLFAQQNDTEQILKKSREDIHKAKIFSSSELKKYTPYAYNSPSWIKGSNIVIHSDAQNFYIIDATTGKKQLLFTIDELVSKVSPITTKSHDKADIRFYAQRFVDKKNSILECRVGGVDLLYNIQKKQFTKKPEEKPEPRGDVFKSDSWKKFNKDSTYYIFGKCHNIYLAKASDTPDKATQLTTDGQAYYSHVMYKNPQTDSTCRSYRGDWFKDTNIAYGMRIDIRKVRTMGVINSLDEPAPTIKEYKFELAGDKDVTQYEINLIDADNKSVKRVDIDKFKDQTVKLAINFAHDREFDAIYFTRISRTCDTLELCAINPGTAEVKVIASEISHPKVNELLHNYAIIDGGNEVIWWSERDGKGAYFLYDKNGNEKNRITDGNFVAGKISSIDTLNRRFIFEGYGYDKSENPQNRKFFKVNFDGTGFTCLTPERGNHSITFSDASKLYFLDTYSTVEQQPTTQIRDIFGKLKYSVAQQDLTALKKTGWHAPKEVVVKAADGITDLYGVVYTPYDLDTTKKYPIICNVYPGPQSDLVPNTFSIDDDGLGAFSQMGFVIIQFGYRGSSPLRGKAFYNYSVGNMRDYALADAKFVVEQLAQKYKYIDIDRVGIFGHSGGGFLSTTAILTYPDFFKVAVAVSGNHDNNIYAKFWGEVYNGIKRVEKDGQVSFESDIATNMELAQNLKGRLFLITGDVDDNVHPANTLRMADALIKANKRFDMMILPGRDHGMIGEYYDNIIRYYFEEHLKNPKDFDVDIVK